MNATDPESLISKLTPALANKLIEDKIVTKGMIPKVQCCIKAVENGVESVHIINGKIQHSILLEIYTKDGIGTVVEKE